MRPTHWLAEILVLCTWSFPRRVSASQSDHVVKSLSDTGLLPLCSILRFLLLSVTSQFPHSATSLSASRPTPTTARPGLTPVYPCYSLSSGLMPWNIFLRTQPRICRHVVAQWSLAVAGIAPDTGCRVCHALKRSHFLSCSPLQLDWLAQALTSRGSLPDACLSNSQLAAPSSYPRLFKLVNFTARLRGKSFARILGQTLFQRTRR